MNTTSLTHDQQEVMLVLLNQSVIATNSNIHHITFSFALDSGTSKTIHMLNMFALDMWILDIGATDHVCSSKTLSQMEPPSLPIIQALSNSLLIFF